ncbi:MULTISPECIES: type III secretion system export apparatus subunit SctT [unclassified Bradyrhizobium]|uniref:type III secretion system export apparatus subunit SctT n=1 Tax=unclassified Bradyrhizobium TaxID=2631580 RepID=UPI0020B2EF5D|nr:MULTISPECIES: type III secretion system export apparatus subunit SctT [unclassified Bradyrhizobium]MCP3460767.1 type III secretion system export apparatus subunit SctT [Bradyrhizobium sp. CCGUVB23]MCP3475781.1 type III secretion system export apparatus subunit SctT [Bradyrhizobium sp. CCGUVB1N3]
MYDLSTAETQSLIQAAIELVVAAGLGAARPAGIMLVLPVFTRPQIGRLIRGCLAVAIELPYLTQVADGLKALDPDTRLLKITLLGLKEACVGLMIGALLSIPLWSLQAVGEIIDTQRGISSVVTPADPATRSQASATGLFIGITAITIFVVSGGLQTMISGLYGSYLIWPVYQFGPTLSMQRTMELWGVLDSIIRTTLLVSGPVVAFLLLVDISALLLERFAPQLNPKDLTLTIKNIGFAIIMVTYAVYLIEYMQSEITQSGRELERLERQLK